MRLTTTSVMVMVSGLIILGLGRWEPARSFEWCDSSCPYDARGAIHTSRSARGATHTSRSDAFASNRDDQRDPALR